MFKYRLVNGQIVVLPADLRGGGDPAPLTIEAADGRKRFRARVYSGGLLHLKEYPHPVIVDLAGLKASQTLPTPKDHDLSNVIGQTDAVSIHATEGIDASGVVDTSKPDGELVAAASKGGLAWEMSIGATAHTMEEVLAGESVAVNGRTFAGPVFVARTATLKEISFVRRGADVGQTHVQIAASLNKGNPMFEEWLKAQGFTDAAAISEPQKASLQRLYDAEIKAKVNSSSTATDVTAALQGFRRALKIEAMLANHPDIRKDVFDDAGELKAGWTEVAVAKEIELKELRASRLTGGFIGATGAPAKDAPPANHVWEAALLIKAGVSEQRVGQWYGDKVVGESLGGMFRAASLAGLMFETIRAAGLHANPGSISEDTIRTALRADRMIRAGRDIRAASGFTSLSLSGVLSNVANKAMIASYESQEVIWPYLCAIRSHNDFKVHTRYRLDSTGAFRKVGPDGELKHIGLTDTSFTNQLDTFGAIISLTRQMQINDDLSAFLEIPRFLGRMGAIRIEEAVFALLLSNPSSFFHASNKNLATGGGSALSLTSIGAAEKKFRDQVDGNAKPILVSPKILLVGSTLKVDADNFFGERLLITGESATKTANNPHVGKYKPYCSPYVDNTAIKDQDGAAITGQSSTKWWMFADPNVRAAIAVAFLNGNRIPTIESDDTEFSSLGMQWRAYHDFGVGMEDPAGAVQSNGA